MAFFRIRERGGKRYWYREERYRKGGKVMSRSVYIGPARLGSGVWNPVEINRDVLNAAREEQRRQWYARPDVRENARAMRAWGRELQTYAKAAEELRKLEERENARQPAKDRARTWRYASSNRRKSRRTGR